MAPRAEDCWQSSNVVCTLTSLPHTGSPPVGFLLHYLSPAPRTFQVYLDSLESKPNKGKFVVPRFTYCHRTCLFPPWSKLKWYTSLVAQIVKNLPACGRPGFNPYVRKSPWRREWLPTPVFLPGESHGQRILAGYSSWGCKESNTTEQLTLTFILGVRWMI